ncbi:MAG: class I SAM-dependent methyltransferase [Bacteroidetes bacterium]|nr:class I SAM-dependent methyltransferase [Bacteroidota bacterium]
MRGLEPDVYQSLHTIRDYCIKNAREIERWPSFYRRRYDEFLSYLSFFPESKLNSVLELGCGIGYQSAFLAKVADRVIATDLEEEDIQDHAPGIKLAEQLHEKLKISNIELKACSAEDLPFPATSFDMVFSSHVFEHIPDQSKALIEIHRVLKPGGIHFL